MASDPPVPKRTLTVAEAAAYVSMTVAALRNQRHSGREPGSLGYAISRRRVVYDIADLDSWLDSQKGRDHRSRSGRKLSPRERIEAAAKQGRQ